MQNKGPEDYLELAQHAEKAAAEADTPIAKNSWRTIAFEYRMLASEKLKLMQGRKPCDKS
jgi:hypothetical protein